MEKNEGNVRARIGGVANHHVIKSFLQHRKAFDRQNIWSGGGGNDGYNCSQLTREFMVHCVDLICNGYWDGGLTDPTVQIPGVKNGWERLRI